MRRARTSRSGWRVIDPSAQTLQNPQSAAFSLGQASRHPGHLVRCGGQAQAVGFDRTAAAHRHSETLSRTDSLYFTVTVFSTAGFGDIPPKSELARIVTTTQMPTGLIVLGLVAKIVFGAVQTAVARREGAAAMRPTAPGRDDTQQPDASADGRSRA